MTKTTEKMGGLPRRFVKMSGAGNDFLVFDRQIDVGARETETIRRICRRGTSVGADGVLFVFPAARDDGKPAVQLEYFNADGSPARFCGNGTRCAARFAGRFSGSRDVIVQTGWGDVEATIAKDGAVTIKLPESVELGPQLPSFDPDERILESTAQFAAVGVPHLVVFTVEGVEVETIDVASLGSMLRRHPELPDGANVNFVSARGPSRLAVRSYERGVEAETLSCGSGVTASAVTSAFRTANASPVFVTTRSGATLIVDFVLEGTSARDVRLTGDARFVFEGTLGEES